MSASIGDMGKGIRKKAEVRRQKFGIQNLVQSFKCLVELEKYLEFHGIMRESTNSCVKPALL